jgi:hypothetical protein
MRRRNLETGAYEKLDICPEDVRSIRGRRCREPNAL